MYSVYSDDMLLNHGFGGYGAGVEEAKADFYESIAEAREMALREGAECEAAEEITVEFKYDIPSFFNCFDYLNASKVANRAGINESQMRQYKAGLVPASEATTKKILAAIKTMAAELQEVSM